MSKVFIKGSAKKSIENQRTETDNRVREKLSLQAT